MVNVSEFFVDFKICRLRQVESGNFLAAVRAALRQVWTRKLSSRALRALSIAVQKALSFA